MVVAIVFESRILPFELLSTGEFLAIDRTAVLDPDMPCQVSLPISTGKRCAALFYMTI
jgi:hypothetical protein